MSGGLGFSLASLTTAGLDTLSSKNMLAWGWRVPFLLGLPLGVEVYWLQMVAEESPEFLDANAKRVPIDAQGLDCADEGRGSLNGEVDVRPFDGKPIQQSQLPFYNAVQVYGSKLVFASGLIAAHAVCVYTLSTWVPLYASALAPEWVRQTNTGFKHAHVITATIMFFHAVILSPLAGLLVDVVGTRKVLFSGMGLSAVAYPAVLFGIGAHAPTLSTVVASQILLSVLGSLAGAGTVVLLSETFDRAELRYSAVSLVYNVPVAVFGGSLNLLATAMYDASGSTLPVGAYVGGMCAVACLCLGMLSCEKASERQNRNQEQQPQKAPSSSSSKTKDGSKKQGWCAGLVRR